MDEGCNSNIVEFFDCFKYAISMAQYKLPEIIIEDLNNRVFQYLDSMSNEELKNISSLLKIYDEYYMNKNNMINELKDSISSNSYGKEIEHVFSIELAGLSANLAKLDFIRDYIANVSNLIDNKLNSLSM